MSVYSVKAKGWRFDFTLKGNRYSGAWFKTKREAKEAEEKKREELKIPPAAAESMRLEAEKTQTDMAFLDLVNRRLDHIKAYNSEKHYREMTYYAKRWVKKWGKLSFGQITTEMVEEFIRERRKTSGAIANKELTYLRALFNFAKIKKLAVGNPTEGVDFFPEKKNLKYIPSPEDIDKVIALADPDVQDYLWTIKDTAARMSEVNRLSWEDINFDQRYVVLYTRKKKGGHLTPRKVPMTQRLHRILSRRFQDRDPAKPWVFWHTYTSRRSGDQGKGPYKDRNKIMRTLCQKAGVRYFRFHALRHASASIMDYSGARIGDIQRILGHENRKTTEIYLHTIGDGQREAIAILEKPFGKNSHTILTQKG